VQYALHPFFQLQRRTGQLLAAALLAGIAGGVVFASTRLAAVPLLTALSPIAGFSATLAVAMLAAGVFLIASIGRAGLPGLAFFLRLGAALAGMAGVVLALRPLSEGLPALLIVVAGGTATYAGLAYLTDLAQIRDLVHGRDRAGLRRRP
jgi:hypothetical protein